MYRHRHGANAAGWVYFEDLKSMFISVGPLMARGIAGPLLNEWHDDRLSVPSATTAQAPGSFQIAPLPMTNGRIGYLRQ
jgi:hypothetical protein